LYFEIERKGVIKRFVLIVLDTCHGMNLQTILFGCLLPF